MNNNDNNKKSKILKIIPKTSSSTQEKLEVNMDIISQLEHQLKLAKAGRLTHLVSITMVDGDIYDGWTYPEDGSKCQPYTMLGAVHSLAADLTNLTIERRE